jgi:hypothetical protein
MMKSFWKNKPVEILNKYSNIHEQILPTTKLLEKLTHEISESKYHLDYIVYNDYELSESKIKDIILFLNKYYITSDCKTFSLMYTYDLLKFYCKNTLVIEFYPKNTINNKKNMTPIGYIFGKKTDIKIYGNEFPCLEVNFLCIMQVLRKLTLSSYMINILTKECIIRYNDIQLACYTIQTPINSPSFCKKQFYHRLLSIESLRDCEFLPNSTDLNLFKKVHNTFKYSMECKNNFKINFINGNETTDPSLIKILYEKYIEYSNKTYYIYQNISFEEFNETFFNKSFYHFIIYNESDSSQILSYICMFRIDVLNSKNNLKYRNGYLYYMFFEENTNHELLNKQNYLEFTHEYIYNNNIFDVISFTDIFDIDYNIIKCVPGSGTLSYYLFNMKLGTIKNSKNGLITI